jgi:hypothetical protein
MPIKLRPYKPEYDQQVVELASQGQSWAEIASSLGISMMDFDAMVEGQPSLAAAVEEAHQAAWDYWIARGGDLVRNPDTTASQAGAWDVLMRSRFGDKAFRTGIRGASPWAKAPAPPPPPNPSYSRGWSRRR